MLLIKVHDDRRSRKDWLQRRLLQPEEDQREDIVTTTHTGTKEKNLQSKSIHGARPLQPSLARRLPPAEPEASALRFSFLGTSAVSRLTSCRLFLALSSCS